MNSKPIAVGLVFGVGLALALNSWLLGIMFGIIFYVALKEADKKENSSSEEVQSPRPVAGIFVFVGQIGALTSHWLIKQKKLREDHNPEVAGSNPAPATMKTRLIDGFFVYRHLGLLAF